MNDIDVVSYAAEHSIKFEEAHAGLRLDKALSLVLEDISRSRLQTLIKQGQVQLNGIVCMDASRKIVQGELARVYEPEAESAEPVPENIPLDVVYEDEHLLVINKQAGLVVHPGAGNWSGTLVNALLYHCGESLSGIGGVIRPGIVHRLDKDTSGLMVVAKNDAAHKGLARQLEGRSLSRIYHALVLKVPMLIKGRVDMPIGRDPRNRLKMTVKGRGARDALTHYHMLENYRDALSLIECTLDTGRTHQIRVHMAAIKHPLIGDPVYGPQLNAVEAVMKKGGFESEVITSLLCFPRQVLHAKQLEFTHPVLGEEMRFESDYPDDISNILKRLD